MNRVVVNNVVVKDRIFWVSLGVAVRIYLAVNLYEISLIDYRIGLHTEVGVTFISVQVAPMVNVAISGIS